MDGRGGGRNGRIEGGEGIGGRGRGGVRGRGEERKGRGRGGNVRFFRCVDLATLRVNLKLN